MNFLSHFYFERDNHDANMVIGVVLPDFVKNAQKDSNLYPLKEKHLFESDADENSILIGWSRHIAVDAVFHSSEFFKYHTNTLKQIILPALKGSPVKPFFLAHIGLELVLDHLLTIHGTVNINTFYEQLGQANKHAIDSFLKKSGVPDTTVFFKFLNSFISSRYLFSYQKIENISYALNRICMRLWDSPFTEPQLALLTEKLSVFKTNIEDDYMSIFSEVEQHLNAGNH
jgi:acyl carrier protein phosphodiesterase